MANPVKYRAKLTGITSMKMHRDDVPSSDRVKAWREERRRDKKVLKGDDRYPCWTWKTYLYSDGVYVAMPCDNIVACLSKAGTQFSLGGGRKTLMAAAVSVLSFPDECFELRACGHKDRIKMLDVVNIDDEAPFAEHVEPAAKLGINLDVRRVPVGQSKHVRARPCFPPGWTAEGVFINTNPDMIPEDQQLQLWQYAGEFCGLGDWRPSAPHKPGRHGRFTVEISRVK